jgi:SAM-dependent methyltransferase
MSDQGQYWKDVYKKKNKFASKKNGYEIPWDIKTFDPNLKELLDNFNLNNGELLELGCGTGYDSNYLHTRGFNVTAIDLSQDAIDIAKQRNNSINFIVGDFFSDLPTKQFDVIYDRGFLHNQKHRLQEIFEKLNSITSKNGKIIIITGNPNQPIIETCMPPPVYIGELEHWSANWFKIILAKEITFLLDDNYENGLGYLFLLEKRNVNTID